MTSSFVRDSVAMGHAVRGACAQAGMTQAELAGASDMALNTLSRRINGSLPFTWPEIVSISSITGVSVSDLVASAVRIAARDAGQVPA